MLLVEPINQQSTDLTHPPPPHHLIALIQTISSQPISRLTVLTHRNRMFKNGQISGQPEPDIWYIRTYSESTQRTINIDENLLLQPKPHNGASVETF